MSVARDEPAERLVGRVTRYDAGRRAMEVALIAALRRGDRIRVRDAVSDRLLFEQVAARLTVEGRDTPLAKAHDTALIDIAQAVKPGDRVFRLSGRPSGPPPPGPPGPEPSWPEPDQPTPPPEPPEPPEPVPGPEPDSPDEPTPDDAPDLPDIEDFDDGGGGGGHGPRHRPKGGGTQG